VIFILGSKGFVGSAFLEACKGRGIPHRGIDVDNYEESRGLACDVLINADGNSKKYIAEEDPPLDFELSVSSVVRSLFDFAFGKYVYISSVAVYNDHADPGNNREEVHLDTRAQSNYGFHKYLAEQLVTKYCGDWLILRLGGMVGRRMSNGPAFDILHGAPLRISPASRFQFINTNEVARVALTMLDEGRSGEIFNVCGRGTVALREIQELAGRVEENELPAETWNVNTEKAHGLFGLPASDETIREFISGRDA
jgi:nucleoside-diphosphate-sugar epimerase